MAISMGLVESSLEHENLTAIYANIRLLASSVHAQPSSILPSTFDHALVVSLCTCITFAKWLCSKISSDGGEGGVEIKKKERRRRFLGGRWHGCLAIHSNFIEFIPRACLRKNTSSSIFPFHANPDLCDTRKETTCKNNFPRFCSRINATKNTRDSVIFNFSRQLLSDKN